MTIEEFKCDNLCWMETLCIALDVSSQQAGATVVISGCFLSCLFREILLESVDIFFSSPTDTTAFLHK